MQFVTRDDGDTFFVVHAEGETNTVYEVKTRPLAPPEEGPLDTELESLLETSVSMFLTNFYNY